jgi:cytidylate kinase
MGVITISRGSYSRGKAVAEKAAKHLGYDVVSRDLLLSASERFHVPEIRLIRAIHDAPGILSRLSHSKQSYLAFIQAALTERVSKDNVVYHGLAGHLLLWQIPGVLKVRITADLETRVANEVQREGISAREAREIILEDDHQRRKWTQSLHGLDPWDSSLYDLVIRVDRLSVDDAVDFICKAAMREGFQTTDKMRQKMEDLALACRIKTDLVEDFPAVKVSSEYGNVIIYAKDKGHAGTTLHARLDAVQQKIGGIYNMEVHSPGSAPLDAV